MPYYVYILECSNKSLYTGITTDLKRRFKQHFSGEGCRYTKVNPPVIVRYYKKYPTRSAASKREAQIKSWTRAKKLALIMGGPEKYHRFYQEELYPNLANNPELSIIKSSLVLY